MVRKFFYNTSKKFKGNFIYAVITRTPTHGWYKFKKHIFSSLSQTIKKNSNKNKLSVGVEEIKKT